QGGIIESYVLGLADAEEVAEIEKLRAQHAEINEAIEEFSNLLEKKALEFAVPPPANVKSKIMTAIKQEQETEDDEISPVVPLSSGGEGNSVVHITFFRKWRIVAAASIILLLASAALNFYYYNKYTQRTSQYMALLSERSSLAANNQVIQARLNEWQAVAEMMADPSMATIKMPDVTGKNNNLATVFWNTKSKDVFVMPVKLPTPSQGKQYQLWALVNGKPVDAGMLDISCTGVCKMKNIPEAQAFAITLEKQGGSASPTMEALLVMGKV
ncbi:MAG TPA: anti-sigma factor, partial [Segetibacter sp.]